jgi:hypothetical protein
MLLDGHKSFQFQPKTKKSKPTALYQQTEKEPSKDLIKISFWWEEDTEDNQTSAFMADICPLKDGQEGTACI